MTPRAIAVAAEPLRGVVVVPGSESITNRAVLIAALAGGTSRLTGALVADDSTAMIEAARALGATVDASSDGVELAVTGTGGTLPATPVTVQANQGATVGRFVAAVAAASPGPVYIDADEQLRARPIAPLLDALRATRRNRGIGRRAPAGHDLRPGRRWVGHGASRHL